MNVVSSLTRAHSFIYCCESIPLIYQFHCDLILSFSKFLSKLFWLNCHTEHSWTQMNESEITFSWFYSLPCYMFWFSSVIKCSPVCFFQSLVNLIKRCGDHLQYVDCITSLVYDRYRVSFCFNYWFIFCCLSRFFLCCFEDYLSKSNAHLYIIDCVHTNILVRDSPSWKKIDRTTTSKRKRCYVVVGWSFRAFPLRCYIIIHNAFVVFFHHYNLCCCCCCCCFSRTIHFWVAKRTFGQQNEMV